LSHILFEGLQLALGMAAALTEERNRGTEIMFGLASFAIPAAIFSGELKPLARDLQKRLRWVWSGSSGNTRTGFFR
jgi:hypothetical protein